LWRSEKEIEMKLLLHTLALLLFAFAPYLSLAQDEDDTPQESRQPSAKPKVDCSSEVVVLPDGSPKLKDCHGVTRDFPAHASVDAAIQLDRLASKPSLDSLRQQHAEWLKRQSQALYDIIRCYLDEDSAANEYDVEKDKREADVRGLVENQIDFLKTLAKHNKSRCR
jgi:hypothetical protein